MTLPMVYYASAAAAGLDDGTYSSAASVGTKQGFSIIQWAGVDNASPSTISHGLTNQTPRFIIVVTTDAENWAVYHISRCYNTLILTEIVPIRLLLLIE